MRIWRGSLAFRPAPCRAEPRHTAAGHWNAFSPRPSHSIKYKSWIYGLVPVCQSGCSQFVHTLEILTARLLTAA